MFIIDPEKAASIEHTYSDMKFTLNFPDIHLDEKPSVRIHQFINPLVQDPVK